MSGIPTNRTNITLPADVSQEILQKTQSASAVMALAQQIPLPGRGLNIPVITSDPTAAWVGETEAKPVSNPSLGTKIMTAYKLAVIMPFSNEFRRDARALYDALVARLPGALAKKFDETVIGAANAPATTGTTLLPAPRRASLPESPTPRMTALLPPSPTSPIMAVP
ncbi:MAG: phage major capsid protein [Lachnospiraceae bacterium]|nr:phage major capsid protein [Lachnospiraceae bacterium]